jgi:nitrite reductase/ring-hydroxylating ferredoxin subunit
MSERVCLSPGERRAVRAGRWVQVSLGRYVELETGRAKSALVGVARGKVVAWANACLHQPLPLDVTSDPEWVEEGVRAAPMDDDRVHLLCHSHGAIYRTRDGYCVSGPCSGQALAPLEVEEEGEAVAVLLPDDD